MSKRPFVYIMASYRNGTLYTGITAHLLERVYQHREGLSPGFTKKYGCKRLVYYEEHADIPSAILREKQIKSKTRLKKLKLIESKNPDWRDLYHELL